MATQKEREDIAQLKTDVAIIQNDMGYVKQDVKKVVEYIDKNKGGINFSTLINSKLLTALAGAAALGLIYMAGGGFAK